MKIKYFVAPIKLYIFINIGLLIFITIITTAMSIVGILNPTYTYVEHIQNIWSGWLYDGVIGSMVAWRIHLGCLFLCGLIELFDYINIGHD